VPSYRCYFLDIANHLAASQAIECEGEAQVQARADELLAGSFHAGIEVAQASASLEAVTGQLAAQVSTAEELAQQRSSSEQAIRALEEGYTGYKHEAEKLSAENDALRAELPMFGLFKNAKREAAFDKLADALRTAHEIERNLSQLEAEHRQDLEPRSTIAACRTRRAIAIGPKAKPLTYWPPRLHRRSGCQWPMWPSGQIGLRLWWDASSSRSASAAPATLPSSAR
jgi:hypothetical protein